MSDLAADRYLEWNAAISEHYFAPKFAGVPVRLAFDDDVLRHIAHSIDADPQEFTLAIASLVRPDLSNAFSLFAALPDDDPHFTALGLLAAQVLTASRMGTFAGIDSTAFWLPFRRCYLNDAPISQITIAQLDDFWNDAASYYAARNLGHLSLQDNVRDVPLRGFRHVNLPLWQVLLRETDRGQLRGWCALNADHLPTGGLELLQAFAESGPLFNRTLAQKLQVALTQPALASALLPMLEEVRNEVRADHVAALSQTPRGRLRLTGRLLRCFLQRRDHFGRWTDVSGPLDATEIISGVDRDTYSVSWNGGERILFMVSERDAGSVRGRVADKVSVLLLARRDDSALPSGAAWERIVLDPALDNLQGVRGNLDLVRDSELVKQFGCSFPRAGLLQFEGGLRCDRGYFCGAQPRIYVTSIPTSICLDRVAVTLDAHGFLQIPLDLPAGSYTVCADDDAETITLVNGDELADSNDGEEIGFELGRDVMRTLSLTREITAGTMLIGAQLWLSDA